MISGPTTRRRHPHILRLGVAAVLDVSAVLAVASGVWILGRDRPPGQAMRIAGVLKDASAPWPSPSVRAKPEGPPYVTYVSPSGRYFLDQYRKPLLVKGDSHWAMMTRMSPVQAELWFKNRQEHGFNAAIVSLIGSINNGGPSDDGSTFRWASPVHRRKHPELAGALLATSNGLPANGCGSWHHDIFLSG